MYKVLFEYLRHRSRVVKPCVSAAKSCSTEHERWLSIYYNWGCIALPITCNVPQIDACRSRNIDYNEFGSSASWILRKKFNIQF